MRGCDGVAQAVAATSPVIFHGPVFRHLGQEAVDLPLDRPPPFSASKPLQYGQEIRQIRRNPYHLQENLHKQILTVHGEDRKTEQRLQPHKAFTPGKYDRFSHKFRAAGRHLMVQLLRSRKQFILIRIEGVA
ncbi:hypothetical protein D3C72_877000 [compost metagenome]